MTSQIVPGKQRKIIALCGALCLCCKTVPIKAPSLRCVAETVCLVPQNDCFGQVIQSQNSTMAQKTPQKLLNGSCKIKIKNYRMQTGSTANGYDF